MIKQIVGLGIAILLLPGILVAEPVSFGYQDSQSKPLNKPITLSFNKTDIRDIVRFFSKEFHLNIIADPDVKGPVSFSFSGVKPMDAFDILMKSQGFQWTWEGDIIYVFKQYPMKVLQFNYISATEASTALGRLVGSKGSISLNESNNSVVIRASQGDMEHILRVARELDQPPLQVLVKVRILDMQLNDVFNYGAAPNYVDGSRNQKINVDGLAESLANSGDDPQGLFVDVLQGNTQVLLEAIETNSNVEILATPMVLAVNHKEATIITGQRLGYKTATSSTSGETLEENIQFLEVGTKLSFVPHISNDGQIVMEIKPEVSEGIINASGLPEETTTEATSTVLVKDGQTIVIGGLIRNKEQISTSKIPILGDIPFLGGFFQSENKSTTKKETVVLITPTIVTAESLSEISKPYVKN